MMTETEIDSKAFQEIVDDFVEVHKAASQEVDLGLVLTEVKIALQSGEKKYKDFLSSFLVSCTHAKAKLDSHIKRLQTAEEEAKHQVANTWEKQLSKGKDGIKESQTGQKKATEDIEKVQKEIQQIIVQYREGVSDADEKLIVVKQLRDIIEDELINRSPGQHSFIQVDKFRSKLKDLESLIKKSGNSLYTPILETLVQLAAEQNFSDQKILQEILKNLNALHDNIKKFKAEREKSMEETIKTLKASEENLVDQLRAYHHLELRNVSDVKEANQNLSQLHDQLLNLAAEISRKQDESRNVEHLCETENKMFKNGLQRINAVKKDVSEAMNTVLDLKK